MTEIILDGTEWKSETDFYSAFFAAVQAPDWHGRNLDALWDSITGGGINRCNLPYTIRLMGIEKMTPKARMMVDRFCALIAEAKTEGFQVELIRGSL